MFAIRRQALPILLRPPVLSLYRPALSKVTIRNHHDKMSATPVYTDKAAQPAGPYSQAIKTPTAIYCSGQIPWDRHGNLVEGTIQEKTAACITSLKVVLEEAGSSIEKVVKVNVFLTDMANFASMNEEYAKWFTHKPARSCVAVKQLPKGVDVEIECIALP
ncbi:Endoribonuclease L-PSP domain containing protein [Rhypophila decipiens]